MAAILGSCQTLSKKECLTANWEALGEADGAAGRPSDHILKHNKACARVDIVPDQTLWLAGRERGLVSYCTPRNAVRVGLSGRLHHNVCPPEKQAAFQQGYDVGSEVERARSRRDSLFDDIRRKQDERARLTEELGQDATKDAFIRSEISDIDFRISVLLGSRHSADFDVRRAEEKMDAYLASLED